jgi:hypothetical protein
MDKGRARQLEVHARPQTEGSGTIKRGKHRGPMTAIRQPLRQIDRAGLHAAGILGRKPVATGEGDGHGTPVAARGTLGDGGKPT